MEYSEIQKFWNELCLMIALFKYPFENYSWWKTHWTGGNSSEMVQSVLVLDRTRHVQRDDAGSGEDALPGLCLLLRRLPASDVPVHRAQGPLPSTQAVRKDPGQRLLRPEDQPQPLRRRQGVSQPPRDVVRTRMAGGTLKHAPGRRVDSRSDIFENISFTYSPSCNDLGKKSLAIKWMDWMPHALAANYSFWSTRVWTFFLIPYFQKNINPLTYPLFWIHVQC